MSTVWKLIALGFALCLKQAYSYKITPLRKHVVFSDVNYNVASQIHRYEGYSQRRFLSTEKHNSKRFRLRKSSLAVKANSMDDGRCSDSENALLGSGLVVLAGIVGFFLLKTLMQSILPFAIVVGK